MKVIIEAKPTPIFNALLAATMVRLRQIQLERWDDFSHQVVSSIEYPQVVMQQTQRLLSV